MPTRPKLTVSDVYDSAPTLGHTAGDIWSGLPSFGFTGSSTTTGIVITPACDLVQRKTDSATYLPILPIQRYFTTPGFARDAIKALRGQIEVIAPSFDFGKVDAYVPPSEDDLQALEALVTERLAAPSCSKKEKEAIDRIRSGISLLRTSIDAIAGLPPPGSLETFLGQKELRRILNAIIRNAYGADTHFLPHDNQPEAWSAVPHSSIALFRYALTVPIQVLDLAQDTPENEWGKSLQALGRLVPASIHCSAERPLKRATLRPRFFADLLTRYVGMHVRLGSPDFTRETIESYTSNLEKALK